MEFSRSEQDYLKTIVELAADTEIVPIKHIAETLGVSVPSTLDMIRRLERKQLLKYHSYKGVELTRLGMYEARFILKVHRVWEYFLVHELGYSGEEFHDEAEILEHGTTRRMLERLYRYLGRPTHSPDGGKIPQEPFWSEREETKRLCELTDGDSGELIKPTQALVAYFDKLKKPVPRYIYLLERLTDGSVLLRTLDEQRFIIPPYLQQDAWLKMVHESGETTV